MRYEMSTPGSGSPGGGPASKMAACKTSIYHHSKKSVTHLMGLHVNTSRLPPPIASPAFSVHPRGHGQVEQTHDTALLTRTQMFRRSRTRSVALAASARYWVASCSLRTSPTCWSCPSVFTASEPSLCCGPSCSRQRRFCEHCVLRMQRFHA